MKQEYSILKWIIEKQIVSEKGEPLDFHDRPFLIDILSDWNNELVVKACAQVGKSVTFTLKLLFAVKHFHFNLIYTFPTDSDMKEFVGTKVNKLIQSNKHEFQGMDTDNIERKELNDRFVYFKGTVSKTAAISTSADIVIHDEASRSDQQALEFYKSRTKASWFKGRWMFSNPTTERDVLDQQWKKSDQKEWMITCPSCKIEQIMRFPDCVDMEKKVFCCSECKGELSDNDRRGGRWVAQYPDSEISGYHLSLLFAPWITAKEIITDSEGDQEYFYNFVLGEPYSPGDLSVDRNMILDNWTPKEIRTDNWFLGVDVGNVKNYTLGSEHGVIKVGKFNEWQVLDDMMAMYKPKLVIDAMPDNTMAKYYVDKYDGAEMSFFQENNANPQTLVWWGEGDKKGIVYSHRDRILDQMFDYMIRGNMLFSVPTDKILKDYIKHFETMRRTKVVNNKGIERYVWESTTDVDHYVFSTLYYYIATLSGVGEVDFFKEATENDKPVFIGNDNVVGDISDMFNRVNP